jgi:predicted small metal-binding protein
VSYEYECRIVVDGCEVRIAGDDRAEVERRAHDHLRDRHGIEELELAQKTAVGAAVRRTYG